MAKGSQNGVLKGKRGNTVFFKIANSNNKEKQGSREYVAEVANPMTVPQATQRVKMTPAIRFYSAFKEDCLDHSFEGVKYGGQSMRHFMKKAFELQTGWPFAQKGLAVALPAEYLMSQGSLNPIQYEFDSDNAFVCDVLAMVDGTLGEWAQSVIDASHGTIQNGDQITIITLEGDNIMAPWPKTVRVVLDTTATEEAGEALLAMGINISPDGVFSASSQDFTIYGGAVILSRPEIAQTTGALTWKRSTQRMAVNYGNREVASLFTQAAYNAAVRSYTKSGNRDIQSDYYLNQGKRNAAGMNIPDAPVNIPFALGVTPQSHNDDSWVYGKFFATMRDTKGKVYLIANAGTNNNVDIYGYDNQGNTDTISNNLYLITQPSTKSAEDAGWLAVKAQYDGVLTTAEAEALAAANGVTVNFTTGA
jgi:hypothetical protein